MKIIAEMECKRHVAPLHISADIVRDEGSECEPRGITISYLTAENDEGLRVILSAAEQMQAYAILSREFMEING